MFVGDVDLPGMAHLAMLRSPYAHARIRDAGASDLMADYFEPVSVLSLARSFGLEDIDVTTLRRWFAAVIGSSRLNSALPPSATTIRTSF